VNTPGDLFLDCSRVASINMTVNQDVWRCNIKAKRTNNSSLISSSSTNPRQLWKNINILHHRSSLLALPSYNSLSLLCQSFANFFTSSILVYSSIVFLPLLTFLLLLLHLTFHPSLVVLLMRFLNSSLSLLTLIVIWILFLHLS